MLAPKVGSVLVKLNIRELPVCEVADERLFFKVIKAAFSQQRKTVLNALSNSFSLPKEGTFRVLNDAGISPSSRAERLRLGEFARICALILFYQMG